MSTATTIEEHWRANPFTVEQYGDPDDDADQRFATAKGALNAVRKEIVKRGDTYVQWHGNVHRERWAAQVGFHRRNADSLEFISEAWISDPRAEYHALVDDGSTAKAARKETIHTFKGGYAEMVQACAEEGEGAATEWLRRRLTELDRTVAELQAQDPRPAIVSCAPRPERKPVRMLMRCAHEFYGDTIPRWEGLDDRERVERTIAKRLQEVMKEAQEAPGEITVLFERNLRHGGAEAMLTAGVRSNRIRVPEEHAMREHHNDVTGKADRTTTGADLAATWIVDDLIAGGYT